MDGFDSRRLHHFSPVNTGAFSFALVRLRQLSTAHAEYVAADVHATTTSFCIREAYTVSCPIT